MERACFEYQSAPSLCISDTGSASVGQHGHARGILRLFPVVPHVPDVVIVLQRVDELFHVLDVKILWIHEMTELFDPLQFTAKFAMHATIKTVSDITSVAYKVKQDNDSVSSLILGGNTMGVTSSNKQIDVSRIACDGSLNYITKKPICKQIKYIM